MKEVGKVLGHLTSGEDLWLASKLGNEALNPAAQLVHSATLAKVAKVIHLPSHLSSAVAFIVLTFALLCVEWHMR